MTKWTIFDKLKMWKNTLASQKMTKLSIFDTIDEAKKYMSLSKSDKMGYFWQFLKKVKKLHGPLRKWQNGAFLTKIVWYITTQSVYIVFFYTYLIIWSPRFKNDKMDHFWQKLKNWKKSNGLSENDKIEHFWQNWRSEKIHEPLTKWQNGAFLTKIVCYITTHSVYS